jgi:hypothetical protein
VLTVFEGYLAQASLIHTGDWLYISSKNQCFSGINPYAGSKKWRFSGIRGFTGSKNCHLSGIGGYVGSKFSIQRTDCQWVDYY